MKTRVLDCGDRQFTILEKGQGPLVLLLHGFPDTHHSWRAQINVLAEAGYHCVAPLMRGYEPSSQTGPYFIAAIASDINAWLKALGQEKAHLIGHDWGAVVSYAYAALYPNRLYSLTTLAIPHMPEFSRGMKEISEQRWNSAYMAFFQLRGIAEWRIKRNNFAYLDKLWRRWSPGWNYKPSQIDKVKQQLAQPGVLTAALSYYRALNAKGREPSQLASNAEINVPTLALGGQRDQCMDVRMFTMMEKSKKFSSDFMVHTVPAAGHFLQCEQPAEVNEFILDWLQKHSV